MLLLLILLLLVFWGGGYYVGPAPLRGNNLLHIVLVLVVILVFWELLTGDRILGRHAFRGWR